MGDQLDQIGQGAGQAMIDAGTAPLALTAPLDGWAAPLSEVPDAVFSGRMMGDGIAIDPTGNRVVAPCDGKVIHFHHARHAVTLRTSFGAEILIHVGLETVALQGDGFTLHVTEGQTVKAGDPLAVVESVKAASDIYAPIDGTVVDAHTGLSDEPETVNEDPEGSGWFVKLKPADPAQIDALMDRTAYEAFLDTL